MNLFEGREKSVAIASRGDYEPLFLLSPTKELEELATFKRAHARGHLVTNQNKAFRTGEFH